MLFHPGELNGLAKAYPVQTAAMTGIAVTGGAFSVLRALYRGMPHSTERPARDASGAAEVWISFNGPKLGQE
jgi:hypothetical protein